MEHPGPPLAQDGLPEPPAGPQDHFRTAFYASPAAASITRTSDGRLVDCNEQYARFFGYAREELLGRSTAELNLWADPAERAPLIASFREAGAVRDVEFRARTRAGDVRTVLTSVTLIEFGGETCALAQFFDVTERRRADEARARAEAALRESEGRFRSLFVASPLGIVTADLRGRFLEANPALHEMLGYAPGELRGKSIWELTHPEDVGMNRTLFRALYRGDIPVFQMDKRYLRKDGDPLWVHVTGTLVRDGGRRPRFAIATVQNVTERRQLEQAALEAAEAERRRLAYELHDDVLQRLAGASALSWTLAEGLRADGHAAAAEAARVDELVRDAAAQARALSQSLAPVDLLAEGLGDALERLCRDTAEAYGIRCRVRGRPARVGDPAMATHLFRIAQEAVSNAARHAAAEAVTVELAVEAGALRLTVRDDGRGFPPGAGAGHGGGLGLRSIRSRAAAMGGTMAIESERGKGTSLTVTMPSPGPPGQPSGRNVRKAGPGGGPLEP